MRELSERDDEGEAEVLEEFVENQKKIVKIPKHTRSGKEDEKKVLFMLQEVPREGGEESPSVVEALSKTRQRRVARDSSWTWHSSSFGESSDKPGGGKMKSS